MDIIRVKDCIEKLIAEIGHCRREIETKGKMRATAIKNYDLRIGVTLAELRHTENFTLKDKIYNAPPVTIMEKIAKSICADVRFELEIAESGYKACLTNLSALLAQLNAYQSLFRHLETV